MDKITIQYEIDREIYALLGVLQQTMEIQEDILVNAALANFFTESSPTITMWVNSVMIGGTQEIIAGADEIVGCKFTALSQKMGFSEDNIPNEPTN